MCIIFVGVFLESLSEFTVDAKSVTPVGAGNIRAIITSPSGTKHDSIVTNKKDGTYDVLYTPEEQGVCTYYLEWEFVGADFLHSEIFYFHKSFTKSVTLYRNVFNRQVISAEGQNTKHGIFCSCM